MFDPPHPKIPTPPGHQALAVQRDSVRFEERDHFAPVEVARQREYGGTSAAHVVEDFARVVDAAEVGEIARQDHQVAIAHHLAHPVEIARRHVNVAEGDDLHEEST